MRLIDQYQHVKSRAGFFVTVDEVRQQTLALMESHPRAPYLDSILIQLDSIKRWTEGGREPTGEERKSLTIGSMLVREFEPAQTDELAGWIERLRKERWLLPRLAR